MRQAVTHYRLPLPDVLFLLNTDDSPICNNEAVLKREPRVGARQRSWRELCLLGLSERCRAFRGDTPALRPGQASAWRQ